MNNDNNVIDNDIINNHENDINVIDNDINTNINHEKNDNVIDNDIKNINYENNDMNDNMNDNMNDDMNSKNNEEIDISPPTPPLNPTKSYYDYVIITGKVMKDKVWHAFWNFDMFEKVDRCYANESYYASMSSLFTKPATHIMDHIYLGSAFNAADYEWLKMNKIEIIVNVTPGITNYYSKEFIYHNIVVEDLAHATLAPYYEDFYRLIMNNGNKKIFVHCFAGKSRSASLVLYYIMKKYGWEFEKAIKYMKGRRDSININCTFIDEIQQILRGDEKKRNK